MARKKEAALKIKGASFALGMNLENLNPYQREKLECAIEGSTALTCAHRLKELVRLVFHAETRDEAEDAFEEFSLVARISKLKPFEKLGESLRNHWDSIMNTIEQGLSNARIEANNNKIKLMIRKAFGFRVMEHLFSIIMLGCSNLRIPLPNRGGFAMKAF
jgi:transposase